MTIQKILVPYNFMPYDQKSLDFITTTFSHREAVEVTLFYSYTPVPEIESQKSPVMERLKGSLSYMTTRIKEQEESLNRVKEVFSQGGFGENQVHVIFSPKKKKDVAAEIIHLVMERGFNTIILNHKPGKVSHFFTGNVFSKVVSALPGVTVCVIT